MVVSVSLTEGLAPQNLSPKLVTLTGEQMQLLIIHLTGTLLFQG